MMFVIFILAALMGAVLLGAALVVWLWELCLSLPVALFIVGVLYVAVMLVVYGLSVREHLSRLGRSLNLFCMIGAACDRVYRKVVSVFNNLGDD